MSLEQHVETLNSLERKMDEISTMAREMMRRNEMAQDLAKDLNIVGNAAMFSLQEELELENVQVDGRELRQMLILFLKNIHNINYAMRQLEAVAELGKESYDTIRGLLLDYIERATEWEKKGYFQSAAKSVDIMARMHESMPRDTLDRLERSAPEIIGLLADLADPETIKQTRQMLRMQKYLVPALVTAWVVPVGLLVLILLRT
ncbi:hypothetical protein SAMN05660653_02645 [Desulfonatronum thiosulfatophilum]|uniref:Uncharacterized protein n=1 Tax=Desulfonatronum thiosulfatophilum TaxID=617002 RepID=A0A1G6E7W9_9BACT|nr:hypothetical protein [Desulfonatronum thiosulfatophilum]SDB53420.1 hypothetical protein SAMN05660653_02645 [Desulfonatronum thiosulfatophilum]